MTRKSIPELEKARKLNNYSFGDMAFFLGISKTYYWQLEKAQRRLSYLLAIKIADIFNVKPDSLFYDYYTKL